MLTAGSQRQDRREGRPLTAAGAAGAQFALVGVNRRLGDSQAQPKSPELARDSRVGLLERVEYPRQHFGFHADAGVGDIDDDAVRWLVA